MTDSAATEMGCDLCRLATRPYGSGVDGYDPEFTALASAVLDRLVTCPAPFYVLAWFAMANGGVCTCVRHDTMVPDSDWI